MSFHQLTSFFCLLLVVAGCNVQTGIAPVEPVILNCSDKDFGFVGTWLPELDPGLPGEVGKFELEVQKGDSYIASITRPPREADDKLEVKFRVHEISEDHKLVIIEIELEDDRDVTHRRLAFAKVKENQLTVWLIDGRKVGGHLFDDGVAAVVEHFPYSSTIRCDAEKLLGSLSKHFDDIVGEPQVFFRKPINRN